MGFRIAQAIKKERLLSLTIEELEALGVDSEAKRGSYLLAQRLAYITGNLAFAKLRRNAGKYYIDLKGGQIVPYLWDRNTKTRRERVLGAIKGARFEHLVHSVVQLADGHIPLHEIKSTIQRFRPKLNEFARRYPELRLVFGKIEATISINPEGAYVHGHLLFRNRSPVEIKSKWVEFACECNLSKFIRLEPVAPFEVLRTVNYLIKHPLFWKDGNKGFPLYEPKVVSNVSDECLARLDEASSNTQFIWLPRKDFYFSIRPSFSNPYDNWLSLWHDDLAEILNNKKLRYIPSSLKPKLENQKKETSIHFKECDGFCPPHYWVDDKLYLVDWE